MTGENHVHFFNAKNVEQCLGCGARVPLEEQRPHQQLTAVTTAWLERQQGSVQTFEKVPHVFLAEEAGELHCSKCGRVQSVKANPAMRLEVLIHYQIPAFERFAEDHLHGIVL